MNVMICTLQFRSFLFITLLALHLKYQGSCVTLELFGADEYSQPKKVLDFWPLGSR